MVKAYLIYTAGKTKIGRKYNKIVYADSNTTIPVVTEGSIGCKKENEKLYNRLFTHQKIIKLRNDSKMLQRTMHIADSLTRV